MQDFVTPQIGPQGDVDRLENRRLAKRSRGKARVVRGKDGKPCAKTRLANRPRANPSRPGEMSMGLVLVCADGSGKGSARKARR